MADSRDVKSAVIVGGGPAGLTLALLLAQRGWNIQILEKRSHPKEDAIKNGQRSIILALMQRGLNPLREAGLPLPDERKGEVWKNGVAVCKGLVIHRAQKTVLLNRDLSFCITERDTLNQVLTEEVERSFPEQIKVIYGVIVTDIDFNNRKISYTSTDSTDIRQKSYSLLVGSDGRSSLVRQKLSEFDPRLKFETKLSGRSWKSFTGLPMLKGFGGYGTDQVNFDNLAVAPTRVVVWPTRNNTMGGYITQPTSFFTESNNYALHYKELIRKAAPSFPEQWLESTANQLVESPLGHIGTAWCSKCCGPSTVLIGDSANAVTPLLGQGVNSALESCLIFIRELDSNESIDAACRAFDRRRQPELHCLQLMDQEGLARIGAKGPFNLKFIAAFLMQSMVWKWLYKLAPSVFSKPEREAMADTLSYRKALDGYKRDETIVKIAFSLLLSFVTWHFVKIVSSTWA